MVAVELQSKGFESQLNRSRIVSVTTALTALQHKSGNSVPLLPLSGQFNSRTKVTERSTGEGRIIITHGHNLEVADIERISCLSSGPFILLVARFSIVCCCCWKYFHLFEMPSIILIDVGGGCQFTRLFDRISTGDLDQSMII